VLLAHGKPCPVSDLFGVRGRELLARLALPEPWAGTVAASLRLIDELDREIGASEAELRRLGAEHNYVRYQRTKTRLGKQRGAKVAQVELARRLSHAIWHMLTRNQPFAPAGATAPMAA
jgi:transposase